MNKRVILASREDCTGCGACKESCPRSAIVFRNDGEGFPTPIINPNRCIQCKQCERVCPVLQKPTVNSIQSAYAAQLLDKAALMKSTSGGLFTAFARWIFQQGGAVFGCIWDEKYNAIIRKAESEDELKPMRGSKYVWSWGGDIFPMVRKYLEMGRIVMFTGLPCQIAGLKNYLGKDFDNLYLVSFLCGGAPSPYAFQEYLKTITEEVPLEKIDLKFRDKKDRGVGVHITYETNKRRVNEAYYQNPYFFAYHTKVFHRKSCYHCEYRYKQRVEDITLGDYWGIEKYHPDFEIKEGVSSMLVNSEKGKNLLDSIKKNVRLSETNVADIAAENNLTLSDKKVVFRVPSFRNAFFRTLRSEGWKSAERKYLFNKTRFKLWLKAILPTQCVSILRELILLKDKN